MDTTRKRHICCSKIERVINSARVQFLGNNQANLERMAILELYWCKGIGSETLLFLDAVLKYKQVQQVITNAQLEIVPVY